MRSGPIFLALASLQFMAVSCNAQVPGCTDPLATNYDPSATLNDGSCEYNGVSVYPTSTSPLSDQIRETSGLILWDGKLWTHNDNDDEVLYGLDTVTAGIERKLELTGVYNEDWEEVSQDEKYIYVGDIGNNVTGNRTNLHIVRVEKGSLLSGSPAIDTIWFSYEDQASLEPTPDDNMTDFDCEAFIVTGDSIYLFTKQWTGVQTSVYRLPKVPGTWVAVKKGTHDVQGLITGATYIGSSRIVVLSGYTRPLLLHPFLYLLYDFNGTDFFSGNKRRVSVELPFHQVEAITWSYGTKYYISNEALSLAGTLQKLHILDLGELLDDYLARISVSDPELGISDVRLFPNPAGSVISLVRATGSFPVDFEVADSKGACVMSGRLNPGITNLDIADLAAGSYTVVIKEPVVSGGENWVERYSFVKL